MTQHSSSLKFIQEKWKHVHTQFCLGMFIVPFFIIILNGKQPKYSLTAVQILNNVVVYTYKGKQLINKKEKCWYMYTWLTLKSMKLREKRQTQKTTYSSPFIWNARKGNYSDRRTAVAFLGLREELPTKGLREIVDLMEMSHIVRGLSHNCIYLSNFIG